MGKNLKYELIVFTLFFSLILVSSQNAVDLDSDTVARQSDLTKIKTDMKNLDSKIEANSLVFEQLEKYGQDLKTMFFGMVIFMCGIIGTFCFFFYNFLVRIIKKEFGIEINKRKEAGKNANS